jgi:8-hydroxy-5-deazaflavin:NADPH oxidoreductase
MQNQRTITILGGTSDLGSGVGSPFLATDGYPVVIGSRAKDKAEQFSAELASQLGTAVRGDGNRGAAASADIVISVCPIPIMTPWLKRSSR